MSDDDRDVWPDEIVLVLRFEADPNSRQGGERWSRTRRMRHALKRILRDAGLRCVRLTDPAGWEFPEADEVMHADD